jgi:hypothetical protein
MTSPIQLEDYWGQNWLVTPAALAFWETQSATTLDYNTMADQKWLLVLSGNVIANLEGNSNSAWLNETVSILPGGGNESDPLALGIDDNTGPLNYAINNYMPIQRPEFGSYTLFSLVHWSPYVALSGIFDAGESINAGYTINNWRPSPFYNALVYAGEALNNTPINNIFTGITFDVGISGENAQILNFSYNITLLGSIQFGQQGTLQQGAIRPPS